MLLRGVRVERNHEHIAKASDWSLQKWCKQQKDRLLFFSNAQVDNKGKRREGELPNSWKS